MNLSSQSSQNIQQSSVSTCCESPVTVGYNYNNFGGHSKLNDLLQYIYITLRSYPAPNIIIMKCEADSRIVLCKLYKSLSVKLNQDTPQIILALNKLSNETPNLILSYKDIEKLYSYGILTIQKLDYSTTI